VVGLDGGWGTGKTAFLAMYGVAAIRALSPARRVRQRFSGVQVGDGRRSPSRRSRRRGAAGPAGTDLAAYRDLGQTLPQVQAAPSGGGPPRHRMVIRDQGKPYVRLVLDAYHRDAISLSSLSTLLDMRVDHLPKLEKELGGW